MQSSRLCMTPYSPVVEYKRFGGPYCLHLQGRRQWQQIHLKLCHLITWCPNPITRWIFNTMKTSTLYNLECVFFPGLKLSLANSTVTNAKSKYHIFTLSFRSAVKTCCRIGLMYFSGSGLNLFCLRKSYKFCSSISNTKQVWFLCWKHSYARTKLNSSAFSWLRRDRMLT